MPARRTRMTDALPRRDSKRIAPMGGMHIDSASSRADQSSAKYAISLRPVKHSLPVAFLARRYFGLRARTVERFIFTATTGRSGTLTLATLFGRVPGCFALHEPYPIMFGEVLASANNGNLNAVDRYYARVKSINILRAAAGHRYYVESNNLFIKTFVEQAARDFGSRLAVIHLVRPPIDVAMSMYRLNTFPGTERGNRWWFDYRAPLHRIRIADALDAGEFAHPFYKALWYWFEVEARIDEWRRRLPTVPFIRFETKWFNDPERVFALLNDLGIAVDRRQVDALAGIREHDREHQKVNAPLSREDALEMLDRFHGLLQRAGYGERAISNSTQNTETPAVRGT
jgi:hypothetical protein